MLNKYIFSNFLQIDYFVDNNMLKEVFQLAGNVINVEILKIEGKSRGMAIVGKYFI